MLQMGGITTYLPALPRVARAASQFTCWRKRIPLVWCDVGGVPFWRVWDLRGLETFCDMRSLKALCGVLIRNSFLQTFFNCEFLCPGREAVSSEANPPLVSTQGASSSEFTSSPSHARPCLIADRHAYPYKRLRPFAGV